MKTIPALLILLLSTTSALAANKKGGTAYVCSSRDNSILMTANLSNDPLDRAVVVSIDKVPKLYSELKGKKKNYLLLVGAVKNSTLQVRKNAKSPVLVSLDTVPETAHVQPAHSGEGIAVTKFDSFLTAIELHLSHEPVNCLETKWEQ